MTYNPEDDPRWLGEADEQPDPVDLLHLSREIGELASRRKAFQSEGWPYVVERIENEVRVCKDRMMNPLVCDSMEKIATERGAIRTLEWLLALPQRTETDLSNKNAQFKETEAAP